MQHSLSKNLFSGTPVLGLSLKTKTYNRQADAKSLRSLDVCVLAEMSNEFMYPQFLIRGTYGKIGCFHTNKPYLLEAKLTFLFPFIIPVYLYVIHFYTHILYPILLHTLCV
jgi:hypothetical protein